jgi:hypothetical protein
MLKSANYHCLSNADHHQQSQQSKMQLSIEEFNELQNRNKLLSAFPVSAIHVFCGRICIVRTESAGVFIGKIKLAEGSEYLLENARRLWRWSGAASLSQLAVDGTADPENCKFPVEMPEVFLTGVIEVIPASEKAIASIKEVKIWEV